MTSVEAPHDISDKPIDGQAARILIGALEDLPLAEEVKVKEGVQVTLLFVEDQDTVTFFFQDAPLTASDQQRSSYISPNSPLGKAIVGRMVNEKVLLRQPKLEDSHVKILSITETPLSQN